MSEHGAVHRTGNRHHARPEVDVHQVLERLAGLAVLDGEARVEPLVQRHPDVGGGGVLVLERGAVLLPANLEGAGPAGVHHVAELPDFVLEVAVDQVGDHHVFLENRQAFRGPQLGNEGLIVIVEARHDGAREVQRIHRFHSKDVSSRNTRSRDVAASHDEPLMRELAAQLGPFWRAQSEKFRVLRPDFHVLLLESASWDQPCRCCPA